MLNNGTSKDRLASIPESRITPFETSRCDYGISNSKTSKKDFVVVYQITIFFLKSTRYNLVMQQVSKNLIFGYLAWIFKS